MKYKILKTLMMMITFKVAPTQTHYRTTGTQRCLVIYSEEASSHVVPFK